MIFLEFLIWLVFAIIAISIMLRSQPVPARLVGAGLAWISLKTLLLIISGSLAEPTMPGVAAHLVMVAFLVWVHVRFGQRYFHG